MHDMEPLAVSIKDACWLLSIGRSTAYRLINERVLAHIKLGRRTLVTVESIRRVAATRSPEHREQDCA